MTGGCKPGWCLEGGTPKQSEQMKKAQRQVCIWSSGGAAGHSVRLAWAGGGEESEDVDRSQIHRVMVRWDFILLRVRSDMRIF